MQDNLVIVESPAKAKTIEKFLGSDYKVMSSYGHIRDLKKKELSIDENSFEADYEIPEEKRKLVSDLKAKAKAAKKVWLASDEDREGEAISWHLCEVLGLDKAKTARIVFHEITKDAILEAIKNPRHLDMNLVNAQQARRILDRIVGFRLSPVLWRKVKPALSAGRVQSVAVRLIVEREREVTSFKSEPYYRISAVFQTTGEDGRPQEIRTELDHRFSTHEEALAFLDKCKNAEFKVKNITKKPIKRSPQPPFTTSTLQQEAARRLGFTVSQTMMMAQRLYESGNITYMRTDSVNLSSLCINASKKEIIETFGKEYSKPRKYHTSSRGAQEAHEAIRPTYMDHTEISGNAQERRLYELIWKRTLASQMADAQIEKTTIEVSAGDTDATFIANGEVIDFPGFLQVYGVNASDDENENDSEESSAILPAVSVGDVLQSKEITSSERYSQGPVRYTEGSLVKKMEELGIGRPSTYAPTVSTIQQREYVVKGDKKGVEHSLVIDTLRGGKVSTSHRKEIIGNEKGKLLPTDIGTIVNDFLMENFPSIMDYNFTANIEEDFDHIAEGKEEWTKMMKSFDKSFHPVVDKVMNSRHEHKAGERQIGIDPKSGKPVFVKIGRFGPIVQIGSADDTDKPRFAQLPKDTSMDELTIDEALELFKLPRDLGTINDAVVTIGSGRYGAYILYKGKYTTLPKGEDPLTISLATVEQILQDKIDEEKQRHLRKFEEDETMEILNGRYGPYIFYEGKNYRLPRNLYQKIQDLTYQQCKQIINSAKTK